MSTKKAKIDQGPYQRLYELMAQHNGETAPRALAALTSLPRWRYAPPLSVIFTVRPRTRRNPGPP